MGVMRALAASLWPLAILSERWHVGRVRLARWPRVPWRAPPACLPCLLQDSFTLWSSCWSACARGDLRGSLETLRLIPWYSPLSLHRPPRRQKHLALPLLSSG